MKQHSIYKNRLSLSLHAVLVMAAVSTYLFSQDDVVWRFIKSSPNARALEHGIFGAAAAVLGIALILRLQDSAGVGDAVDFGLRPAAANLLQAIGIGSLLPLPGFLLLVFGNIGISFFLATQNVPAKGAIVAWNARIAETPVQPKGRFIAHIGLFCAFISMLIFSICLIDRVADVLFAATACVSVVASLRRS